MGSTQSTWGYKPKNFKPQHFYNQQLLRSFYSTDLNLAHTKQTPPPIQTPQTSANMVRGEASIVKCHYKGKTEDFVIFVDDVESAEKWKTDKSIPLAQVVSSFKVRQQARQARSPRRRLQPNTRDRIRHQPGGRSYQADHREGNHAIDI